MTEIDKLSRGLGKQVHAQTPLIIEVAPRTRIKRRLP